MTVVVFPNTAYTPYIIYTAGFLVFASFFSSCDIMCRLTFLPHLQSTIYFPFCQELWYATLKFLPFAQKSCVFLCTKRTNTADNQRCLLHILYFFVLYLLRSFHAFFPSLCKGKRKNRGEKCKGKPQNKGCLPAEGLLYTSVYKAEKGCRKKRYTVKRACNRW